MNGYSVHRLNEFDHKLMTVYLQSYPKGGQVLSRHEKELAQIADSWGADYQVIKVKSDLIAAIKEHCQKKKISQRQLASMVPGLSQDRVSKIFTGQIGHMSIDKLIEIHSALKLKVTIKAGLNGHR